MGRAAIKNRVVVDERCRACFCRVYENLLQKFHADASVSATFLAELETVVSNNPMSSPEIQRELSKRFAALFDNDNPFADEKKLSNQMALQLYKEWKPRVESTENPMDLALRLAIAGNIMDYGAFNSFSIRDTINSVMHAQFATDHSIELFRKIQTAKNILYLGDNAGEIVFDRLFIETMTDKKVSFAVKSGPVLNDVTMQDAEETGMQHVAEVISNGYDAPSTVLSKCSDEFRNIYRNADVIIAKGQGNFEGLIDERDDRLFFIMMVKCDTIAEKLKVPVRSMVVLNSKLQ